MQTFNQKFINNWEILTTAKVGFEFELYSNYAYLKTLELLNVHFSDVNKVVWGFNSYHSNFTPTDKAFKIEPDYSGGPDMLELVTGPMSYVESRIVLIKMLEFIKKYGYTDNHSSIHINISFNDNEHQIQNINPLKLILDLNEEVIYDRFPNRRNNIYCQSVQWIIPFQDYPDPETGINQLLSGLILPEDTKYYGVNLSKKNKGWLEWRYIGGKDYEFKSDSIIELLDYFILQTYKSFEPLNDESHIKLFSYLDDNISWYMNYQSYDSFLSNIDGIRLEYDGSNDINKLRQYWHKIKDTLFNIIKKSKSGSLKDGLFNYNSQINKFEIIECNINDLWTVNDVIFINCLITNMTCYNCEILDSEVQTSHIYDSKIKGSKINTSKIANCEVSDLSELNDCLFDGNTLEDTKMDGGVFRSGKIGNNCEITMKTKMSNKESFWNVYDPGNKKISLKK